MLRVAYQRYRSLIPALALVACCISTCLTALNGTVVLAGTTYDFALSARHYGAFAVTGITLISFFFFRRYYVFCLGASILLGLFNLLYFTALQTSIGFGFGELSFDFNPTLLLIGFLAYLLNFQQANTYFFKLIKPSPTRITRARQEEIAQFKERFSSKSTEEINQLIAANRLAPAALTAARQLVRERT